MNIKVSGKYNAVSTTGEVGPVEILTIRAYGAYPVIASVTIDDARVLHRFTSSGVAEPGGYGFICLREHPSYADWPIDAEILVWDDKDDVKIKRHFAGCLGDVLYAWSAGETSWTTDGSKTPWRFMKLREKLQ